MPAQKSSNPFLNFAAGSMAGCFAESITHPLDCAKTRLQLQEHVVKMGGSKGAGANAPQYRGMFRTIQGIIAEEGVFGLYKGLPPALVRQVIKSGFQMSVYTHIRGFFTPDGMNSKEIPLWRKSASAMTAGVIGQGIGNPCDVVKVRLQADGREVMYGRAPRYTGSLHCLSTIVKENGVLALWKGGIPSVQRAAVTAGAGLASYDHIKQALLRYTSLSDSSSTHTLTTVFSALTSVTCACPFDVVKSRVMNQDLNNPIYRGGVDCAVKTVRSEGVMSLYKGFIPTYTRVFPWQFLFFVSYERINKFLTGDTL